MDLELQIIQLWADMSRAIDAHDMKRANRISDRIADLEAEQRARDNRPGELVTELWPGAKVAR